MRFWTVVMALLLVGCSLDARAGDLMERVQVRNAVIGCSSFKLEYVSVEDGSIVLEGAWKNFWRVKPKKRCVCTSDQVSFKSFLVPGEESDIDHDPVFLNSGVVAMSLDDEIVPGRYVIMPDAEQLRADDSMIEVRFRCAL